MFERMVQCPVAAKLQGFKEYKEVLIARFLRVMQVHVKPRYGMM